MIPAPGFSFPAFDASQHAYAAEGKRLHSVTQILEGMGLYKAWGRPEDRIRYQLRGEAVHMACLDICKGHALDVVLGWYDPIVHPYVMAWDAWCRDHTFVPDLDWCERALACSTLGFAGTPDFVGTISGGQAVLVDVKSGSEVPLVGLQLAAYRYLLKGFGVEVQSCRQVNTKKNQKYYQSSYDEGKWSKYWICVINLWNLRKEFSL